MRRDSELSFMREVFRRSHIAIRVCEPGMLGRLVAECQEEGLRDERFMPDGPLYARLTSLRPVTLYRLTDSLRRCFICFLLPWEEKVALIGPFLSEAISDQTLLSMGEELGVSAQKQRYLREYYRSLPVLSSEGRLATMLGTFCEIAWETPLYTVEEIGEPAPVISASEPGEGAGLTDLTLNVKALEMRYAFENEMMRAVAMGQTRMEERLVSVIGLDAIEKRVANPLRNIKNYGVIMNTLLRKAAEQGGVHPIYIDRASSELARRIEETTSTEEGTEVMREMFRVYCRLVRRHSIQKYSTVVKRAIIAVDTDLSADLSPSALAETVGVSVGYLSAIFRKETGSTLTEYVRGRRMELAEHLLSGTELQIQTVALHCGIMDVQYFTKLFKRQTGMTPTEYRSANRRGSVKDTAPTKFTPSGR